MFFDRGDTLERMIDLFAVPCMVFDDRFNLLEALLNGPNFFYDLVVLHREHDDVLLGRHVLAYVLAFSLYQACELVEPSLALLYHARIISS